jgi:hypothetical protein
MDEAWEWMGFKNKGNAKAAWSKILEEMATTNLIRNRCLLRIAANIGRGG